MKTAIDSLPEKSTSYIEVLLSKEDQFLATAVNPGVSEIACNHEVSKNFVNFFFCVEGNAKFEFSERYSRQLNGGKNYFIYDPSRDFRFNLLLSPGCKLVFVSISLEALHKLFVNDPHQISFLKAEGPNNKFYDERDISSGMFIVLNQLFKSLMSKPAQQLFFQSKVLEILSFYFSNQRPDTESCPFLDNQEMVRKLKHAKDFLLERLESPPTLREIARAAGLNEQQLKKGFKEVYGSTVYNYLLDHRLENARHLLDSGKYRVKEVSFHIGYSNASHFIAAFRRKFGMTPKKYLQNR